MQSLLAVLLLVSAAAAKDSRTFAVNHFYGQGPLMMGRVDPIVDPGQPSAHVHAIQGGNAFAETLSDTQLLKSTCTSSLIKNDNSVYWSPAMYFQDPTNGSFISVPMFYMNVYYFFEATDDDIEAFPVGLRMLVGDTTLRTPPATGGTSITLANQGIPPQPVQFTCPRSNYNTPSYPVGSTGLDGVGIQDPGNQGAGAGFPDMNCDGYASPLRSDIHFPSCYNPAVGVDDYKNNMAWPTSDGTTGGKQNCPAGYIHTPHIFYEVYWNTPLFADLWTQGQGTQPFILANGDRTGYSLHADFISGWDVETLQQIIDNCDAGDSGMDQCPGLIGGVNDASTTCNLQSPVNEVISGVLDALPGNNPPTGWGQGSVNPAGGSSSSSSSSSASTSAAATPTSPSVSTSGGSLPSSPSPPAASQTSSTSDIQVISTPSSIPASESAWPTSSSVASISSPPVSVSPSAPTSTGNSTSVSGTTGTVSISGWTYSGCYSDNLNTRALTGINLANLGYNNVTSTGCIEYCGAWGYSIAGTEWSSQCFCGNELNDSQMIEESNCAMPCIADSTETCGGSLALSVYQGSGGSWRKARRAHPRHLLRHAEKAYF